MMQAIGPLWATAVRRATLGVVLVLLLGALVAIPNPSTAAAAEPPKALAPAATGLLEIVTVPKLPGARFTVDGQIHRADRQGVIRLRVASGRKHKVSVIDKKIADSNGDRTLEFVRWYHGNHEQDHLNDLSGLTVKRNLRIKAGYRATYKLQYSFVDNARNPVDQTRVSRVEFRSDNGQTVSGNGSGKLTMLGIRPVVTGGTIIAKRVSYTVQRVDVDGSNVVQVNVQRFEPSRKATVLIPLQLHTLHFSTRDFLFGNPVGQSVWLKYPDGHRFKVPLDAEGKATVERLARGSYTVKVDAPGLSFERPLVLSRTQYVDLPHVSRADMAVAGGAIAAFMLILYLVRVRGRPVILRSGRLGQSRISAATRWLPRVKLSRQQSSTPRIVDQGDVGTAGVDARKVAAQKELAQHQPDGADGYRTLVEKAQLPNPVRNAALREVGKLERTSAKSPESGDIRTWLDTLLNLPWSTKAKDVINHRVQSEVGPAAANTDRKDHHDAAAANADRKDTDNNDAAAANTDRKDTDNNDAAAAHPDNNDAAAAQTDNDDAAAAQTDNDDTNNNDTEVKDTDNSDPSTDNKDTDTELVNGEKVGPALTDEIAWPMPPWAADIAMVQKEKVDPDDAPAKKSDTAAPDAHEDVEDATPAVISVDGGERQPLRQPPEQRVTEPELIQSPPENRHRGSLVIGASVLTLLFVGMLLFGVSRDGGVTAQSVPTVTSGTENKPTDVPSDKSTNKAVAASAIQLENLPGTAKPFQTVPIRGTYPGGANTFLTLQRWEAGKWQDFPLPTKTDQSGHFSAHVELGRPGAHQLRVLDPASGVASKNLVLVIKG